MNESKSEEIVPNGASEVSVTPAADQIVTEKPTASDSEASGHSATEPNASSKNAAPEKLGEKPTEKPAENTTTPQSANDKKAEEPKVIIKKERGFAHYVGFILLTFLTIVFFFMPGLSIDLLFAKLAGDQAFSPTIAWLIAALFSIIVWILFKVKIKGFKRASAWYIVFCGILFAIWLLIWQFANFPIFGNLAKLLLP